MTKSMCGAECWTDHRLLVSSSHYASIHKDDLKGRNLASCPHNGVAIFMRLELHNDGDKSVSEDLTRELDSKLAELHLGQSTIEEDWGVLRYKIHDTAFQLLGPTTRKNRKKSRK